MDRLGQFQTFETFQVDDRNRAAYDAARAMLAGLNSPLRPGLMLLGPVGSGKTHLACALGEAWRKERGGSVGYTSVSDLMDRLRAALDHQKWTSEWIEDAMSPYKYAGLCILDDMGVEKQSEWTQEQLFKIVNHRMRTLAPVVVTSNFPLDELADRVGVRIVSRLQEMCVPVELLGADRRLKQLAAGKGLQ